MKVVRIPRAIECWKITLDLKKVKRASSMPTKLSNLPTSTVYTRNQRKQFRTCRLSHSKIWRRVNMERNDAVKSGQNPGAFYSVCWVGKGRHSDPTKRISRYYCVQSTRSTPCSVSIDLPCRRASCPSTGPKVHRAWQGTPTASKPAVVICAEIPH